MVLAVQTLLDVLGNPATSWIVIPLVALFIPIVAIICEPIQQRMRIAERREARQTYERLAREKLEVMRAGITMGYSQEDLRELDARLERLLGADKLKNVLDPTKHAKLDKEMVAADMSDLDAAPPKSRAKTAR